MKPPGWVALVIFDIKSFSDSVSLKYSTSVGPVTIFFIEPPDAEDVSDEEPELWEEYSPPHSEPCELSLIMV